MKFREKEKEESGQKFFGKSRKKKIRFREESLYPYILGSCKNIEYIVIEIFFEKRKKIKKGNSRKRKRKIVHSESFYSKIRTEIRVMHCTRVGGKWLERTPFSCPHIDSEKTKEMKRKRKKIRKNNWFSPKSNFLFNSIDWVRVSTKILGGKRAATGNRTCIVSYHNPEYTPCQRLRASTINGQASKRNLRAKETRRKGERGKEKDIYTYVCIYICIYTHKSA